MFVPFEVQASSGSGTAKDQKIAKWAAKASSPLPSPNEQYPGQPGIPPTLGEEDAANSESSDDQPIRPVRDQREYGDVVDTYQAAMSPRARRVRGEEHKGPDW
jgi:hypothetical protein